MGVKVRFLKTTTQGNKVGQVAEISEERANKLINQGVCERIRRQYRRRTRPDAIETAVEQPEHREVQTPDVASS
jgi:hypothetical protein